MKLQNATALAIVAVGAASLVQRERHQQQQNQVAVTQNQLDWLRHVTTHPDFAQLWKPEDMPVDEYIKLMHVNGLFCALSLRHRLGVLRGRPLRHCADWVMKREYGRKYWERFGSYRVEEADVDGTAIAFNDSMTTAYERERPRSTS